MLNADCMQELRSAWLPHITDAGLNRVVELLERASPLLIHGSFSRAVPMGCLATHIAWNHPKTAHLTVEAGISWLNRVAHLNPATSCVIREWDRGGVYDLELRGDLLQTFREECTRRTQAVAEPQQEPALV